MLDCFSQFGPQLSFRVLSVVPRSNAWPRLVIRDKKLNKQKEEEDLAALTRTMSRQKAMLRDVALPGQAQQLCRGHPSQVLSL